MDEFEFELDFNKIFGNALLYGTAFIKYTVAGGFEIVEAEDYKYIPKEWIGERVNLEEAEHGKL